MSIRARPRSPLGTQGARASVALVALILSACSLGGEREPSAGGSKPAKAQRDAGPASAPGDAVLSGIGLSTDPYGTSSPDGFGVARGIVEGKPATEEVTGDEWCTFHLSWLGPARILVPRHATPVCGQPVVFRYRAGRLERAESLSLPPELWTFALSPDSRLVAAEPSQPCCDGGARPSSRILVAPPDGSDLRQVARGHLGGWTPDGRLLVSTRNRGEYVAVDPVRGERTAVLSYRRVAERAHVRTAEIAPPRWSADGRYLAAQAYIAWPKRSKTVGRIALARADGSVVRLLRSPYAISMFAWSPEGHRLAYTTSGFPAPHELFLLEGPRAQRRRIFKTARHFDWITWSPDSR